METFSMTFAENRTYGVPEFAGMEVNRHSGKLKGLSGGQGKKGLHHNMENTPSSIINSLASLYPQE